jgi:hypothetical protein
MENFLSELISDGKYSAKAVPTLYGYTLLCGLLSSISAQDS